MGYRFRRTIKVAPGIRLNLSKSGASVSMGVKGATVNVGPKGVRTTVGIPGTGLSYVSYRRHRKFGMGAPNSTSSYGALWHRNTQIDKWPRVRSIAIVLTTAAIGIVVVDFASNHRHPVVPATVAAAPAVGIAAPPTPPMPSAPIVPTTSAAPPELSSNLRPQAVTPLGNAVAPTGSKLADSTANVAVLAATLERLRAERSRVEAAAQSNPPQQQTPQAPVDQAQKSLQPSTVATNLAWTYMTSAGTRWHLDTGSIEPTLLIDLGGGEIANVHVAAQFRNLTFDAMTLRVDWIRSQILQSYSAHSANYRYTRDGSIYPVP